MTRTLRRHLYVLHAYVVISLVVFVVLALSAFRQAPSPQKFTELTAERINIVDADGTLRLVISNKDRMHPGVIGGTVIQRSRPVAGRSGRTGSGRVGVSGRAGRSTGGSGRAAAGRSAGRRLSRKS